MYVHWYEGLFLQPHHLQLLQLGSQENLQRERSLVWQFPYGLVNAEFSTDELAARQVAITSVRLFMKSGLEVRFPEESTLPKLDISGELNRHPGGVTILLAVPPRSEHGRNSFNSEEETNPRVKLRYGLKSSEIRDENTGDNPRVVQLRKLNCCLLTEYEEQAGWETLPLMRVKVDPNRVGNVPYVDPEFVPPCLVLNGSPTLVRLITNLSAHIQACRGELDLIAAGTGAGLEVRLENTQKLRTLSRFSATLSAFLQAPVATPFQFYVVLRELLGELAAYRPGQGLFDCQAYDHDQPALSFHELDAKIRRLAKVERSEPIKVPFVEERGWPTARFREEHFTKVNGWYLGIKTKLDRTSLTLYVKDPDKFKLMPLSRAGAPLWGVRLQPENSPPWDLPQQPDLHYFTVVPKENADRWDELVEEKAAVLFWQKSQIDLSDASFAFYMTVPTGGGKT